MTRCLKATISVFAMQDRSSSRTSANRHCVSLFFKRIGLIPLEKIERKQGFRTQTLTQLTIDSITGRLFEHSFPPKSCAIEPFLLLQSVKLQRQGYGFTNWNRLSKRVERFFFLILSAFSVKISMLIKREKLINTVEIQIYFTAEIFCISAKSMVI